MHESTSLFRLRIGVLVRALVDSSEHAGLTPVEHQPEVVRLRPSLLRPDVQQCHYRLSSQVSESHLGLAQVVKLVGWQVEEVVARSLSFVNLDRRM